MRPELFRLKIELFGLLQSFGIEPIEVGFPAYFVMLLSGFAMATAIAVMWSRRIGHNPDVIVDIALAALLMGVVGGRIFHVLFDGMFWDYVNLCIDPSKVDWPFSEAVCLSPKYQGAWDPVAKVCHPVKVDCLAWTKFWAGGLTYYGGFVFSSITCLWLLKRDRYPVWKACDLSAAGIAVGLGFGRMGCLLAGCCFGKGSDGPWAMSFPPRSPASDAQFELGALPTASAWSNPVLPTQVMESLMSFGVAAFCIFYLQSRKKYDGHVFVAFAALYAAGRILLEFVRADDRGGIEGIISTSQWIGLVIIAIAYGIHRWRMSEQPTFSLAQRAG